MNKYWDTADHLEHPGGMQVIGSTLAVSWEDLSNGHPAEVRFYNVSDPTDVTEMSRLVLDGSRGEQDQTTSSSRSTGVAIHRLHDLRYLMFVSGSSSGADGWFYISNNTRLDATTQWQYVHYWSWQSSAALNTSSRTADWGYWQNFQFISDCTTNDLYLAAMGSVGNSGLDRVRSRARLYKLINRPGDASKFDFTRVASKNPDLHNTGSLLGIFFPVSMRFGATLFVRDNGNLVGYATSRNQEPPNASPFRANTLWIDQLD